MKSLLITLLLLGTAFSEDAPKPKFANPVLTTYSKAVEDADLQALRVKREARNKAVFALDAEINKAMSAKDLDKAVWLREEKTRISKEWIPSDGELIGEKPNQIAKKIIGNWKHHGQLIEFTKEGNIINPWNEPWTYEITEDIIIVHTTGSGGGNGPYKMKLMKMELIGKSDSGKQIQFVKIGK